MRRARYRLAQFFTHLRPHQLTPAERAEIEGVLGGRLAQLFRRQTAGEQAHALRVMRAVAASGAAEAAPRELLQAALLHDMGKSVAPLSLPDRALVVLARRLAPDAARRWGAGPPRGWRKPFVTGRQHADWGADLAAEAGAPLLTVDLIRRHQTPPTNIVSTEDQMLVLLQAADDDN